MRIAVPINRRLRPAKDLVVNSEASDAESRSTVRQRRFSDADRGPPGGPVHRGRRRPRRPPGAPGRIRSSSGSSRACCSGSRSRRPSWGWLAWVALVAAVLAGPERAVAGLAIYLGAWLGGLAFWLLAIHWVRLTDPTAWLGWVVMALVLSLCWPAFLASWRGSAVAPARPAADGRRAGRSGSRLEYVRAYMFTGFPWYYLAHSQYASSR